MISFLPSHEMRYPKLEQYSDGDRVLMVYVSGAGGRYRRSTVCVFEPYWPEVVKVLVKNPGPPALTGSLLYTLVNKRSRLVGRCWLIAKLVHDGKTGRSKGFRARIEARKLIQRLMAGQNIQPNWERGKDGKRKIYSYAACCPGEGESGDGGTLLRDARAQIESY